MTNGANSVYLFMHKKYRSHIDIIALILDALRYDGIPRYSIMKQTGINYAQLKKYLGSLNKAGFIEILLKDGKVLYRASQKGLTVLTQYNILREMLSGAFFGATQSPLLWKGYNGSSMPQNAAPLAARLPK